MRNPNARSPTQANLMQVCESIYDKSVVDFKVTIRSVSAVYRRCAQSYATMENSSRLIPLVDELTHILIEAGKNKLQ
jgi:hypothetical protein